MTTETAAWRASTDEDALLASYAKGPTPKLEAELLVRFTPLAKSLARRYGRPDQTEDLNQIAGLALVKALRRYDPQRGRRFVAFAAPTILGEIRRHFRDNSWRLHVPRSVQEASLAVSRSADALADEHGRSPTLSELAEHTGLDPEEVAEAIAAQETQRSISLDLPVNSDDADSVPIVETLGREEVGYGEVEAQMAVEGSVTLDPRELEVIELRFTSELNQYEIGAQLGISQMQVSRILRRALAKLLEAVQGDPEPTGTKVLTDDRPDARFPNGRIRSRVDSRTPRE